VGQTSRGSAKTAPPPTRKRPIPDPTRLWAAAETVRPLVSRSHPSRLPGVTPDDSPEPLLRLHQQVDEEAAALARLYGPGLVCRRGCSACCVDGLTVFEVEADRIRRGAPELLRSGLPHAPGRCAFLDSDLACRIYEHRPYVCRTQGLPLRWLEETPSGEIVEERDVCELNLIGTSLVTLPESDLWLIGPFEQRLARLQQEARGNQKRVALRSLFERNPED
jgi:Fe-S-cluster containining protein